MDVFASLIFYENQGASSGNKSILSQIATIPVMKLIVNFFLEINKYFKVVVLFWAKERILRLLRTSSFYVDDAP